jgi:hypothetical protein
MIVATIVTAVITFFMVFNYLVNVNVRVVFCLAPFYLPIITANNQAIVMAIDTTIADPISATASVNALFFIIVILIG